MPYTDPQSGHNPTAGATIPASWGDTVRDDLQWLAGASSGPKPSCRVYNSAAISVANNANVALTFNSERFDNAAMHSTSSNTSRLTVPTGGAGLYLLGGSVAFAANSTGYRYISIYLNGATHLAINLSPAMSGNDHYLAISTLHALSDGDYVELVVAQTSGAAVNVLTAGNYSPEFWAIWQAL